MHYSGTSKDFLNLHKKFKKAIEFQATIESLAYSIAKTKKIKNPEFVQYKFNQICEKLCIDKELRDLALENYVKNEIEYLDPDEKYLFALHKASNLALKIDTKSIKK